MEESEKLSPGTEKKATGSNKVSNASISGSNKCFYLVKIYSKFTTTSM